MPTWLTPIASTTILMFSTISFGEFAPFVHTPTTRTASATALASCLAIVRKAMPEFGFFHPSRLA